MFKICRRDAAQMKSSEKEARGFSAMAVSNTEPKRKQVEEIRVKAPHALYAEQWMAMPRRAHGLLATRKCPASIFAALRPRSSRPRRDTMLARPQMPLVTHALGAQKALDCQENTTARIYLQTCQNARTGKAHAARDRQSRRKGQAPKGIPCVRRDRSASPARAPSKALSCGN